MVPDSSTMKVITPDERYFRRERNECNASGHLSVDDVVLGPAQCMRALARENPEK